MRFSALILVIGMAFPAYTTYAMDAFTYQTESGTQAYTDTKSRIPDRYKADAKRVKVPSLMDYERTTITERTVTPVLPEIPEYEQPKTAAVQAVPVGSREVLIDMGNGLLVPVEVQNSDEPVFVDKQVYRWEDGLLYPYTVVKQGDKVLVEVREEFGN